MGKPSAPAPPDYVGAAQEQGRQNIQGAFVGSQLANPTTVSPFATTTYTNPEYDAAMAAWNAGQNNPAPAGGGSTGNPLARALWRVHANEGGVNNQGRPDPSMFAGGFTRNVTLSPQIQALFDRAGQGIDFSGLRDPNMGTADNRKRVEDALYRRSTQFLDERRGSREADLLNRGLNMGSQGYNENLAQFDTQYADAADRAILAGGMEDSRTFGQNMEQRRQGIAELLRQRSLPFEEYANVAGFLPPAPGAGSAVPGAPVMDATNAAYNAALQGYNTQAGQYGSTVGALAGLGSAAIMASDRRLKSNIIRVGTHPRGIGVYRYRIFGQPAIGVMAQEIQEVMPEAVVTMPSGYLAVRYDMIGWEPNAYA